MTKAKVVDQYFKFYYFLFYFILFDQPLSVKSFKISKLYDFI